MARNGAGTFTLPVADYTAGTTISSSDMNSNLGDIETALTNSIATNGETPTTARIPFASGISTDTITEVTSATGVTIDSVLLKDGGATLTALLTGTTATFSSTVTFSTIGSFADGSVSAPSITNTGDTNTGIYFPSADAVAITAGGVDGLRVLTAASGVNYLQVTPAATGGVVDISAAGSDTNLGLKIATKGTDPLQLYVGTLEAVRIAASTSAVNYFTATASATTAPLTLGAAGSDTNIGINIVPKGDGVLAVNGNTLTDASDNIPVARLNSGTSAGATTYWRGDGTWVNPHAGRTFTSSALTLTAGSAGNSGNLAHGLGAVPFIIQLSLVAQATPELNYTEGDEVRIDFGTINGNNAGVAVVADATNINVYPSTSLAYVLPDKSTNALTAITLSKWKMIVRAKL